MSENGNTIKGHSFDLLVAQDEQWVANLSIDVYSYKEGASVVCQYAPEVTLKQLAEFFTAVATSLQRTVDGENAVQFFMNAAGEEFDSSSKDIPF